MQLSFGKNYFPLFIVCGNRFYFGHVFIKQLMHFPSGILLYKNLPIYSMVNRISFCSRNSMFLPGKFEKFPLLIVCRIWFHFGPLLRSAGKTKNITMVLRFCNPSCTDDLSLCLPAKMYWGMRKNFLSYIVCRIRSSFTEVFERAVPNGPDYFETIYPPIYSMPKRFYFLGASFPFLLSH